MSAAAQNVDALVRIGMRKKKSPELLDFMSKFAEERKVGPLDALRKKIAKKIPYEERLSKTVSELREERF